MSAHALQPHVSLANEFVVFQLGRRARQANSADLQQISAVDHLEHLLDVLLDDENREPFRANAADEREYFLHDQRSKTCGRLVHPEEPRPGNERAADWGKVPLSVR